ncbi:MAG TPA: IPT/TIG domain-containing protein, partial [Candidatus Solibacter sp.]|nr:IPT/TIG domain-containing protein [Candidatus Solibacter sp.]
ANDGVSPGEIVTIFGFNLGGVLASGRVTDGQLPTQIGGTRVLFDGVAAALVYSSSTAISAIVPYDIAGKTSTNMVVQAGNSKSQTIQLAVLDAIPALVTANSSGAGQAAALNQDGSLNSPSNPARAGDIVVLFGTGEGLVSPLPSNGAIVGSPAPAPLATVTATIGGVAAPVIYAGGAPGEPAGVLQINLRIPPGLPSNHHTPVVWSAGSRPSQSGVTIAIE